MDFDQMKGMTKRELLAVIKEKEDVMVTLSEFFFSDGHREQYGRVLMDVCRLRILLQEKIEADLNRKRK